MWEGMSDVRSRSPCIALRWMKRTLKRTLTFRVGESVMNFVVGDTTGFGCKLDVERLDDRGKTVFFFL